MSETMVNHDLGPTGVPIEELRAAVRGRSEQLTPELAMNLLRHREYPEKQADLEELLLGEQYSSRVRHTAAVQLGRLPRARVESTLRRAMRDASPIVARGALSALARLGDRATLGEIRRLKPTTTAFAEAVRWASTIMSYRLEEDAGRLPLPREERYLSVKAGAALQMTTRRARARDVRKVIDRVTEYAVGVRFSERGALDIRCAGERLMFLANADFDVAGAPSRVFERKTLPGVVATRFTLEGLTWEPRYYVLTQPGDGDEVEVLMTTTSGRLAAAGAGRRKGRTFRFTLRSVRHPGAVPMQIEGSFSRGAVNFQVALSDPRSRAPRIVPRLL